MLRRLRSGALTASAALLVFAALVVPDQVVRLKTGQSLPAAFLRLPLEGLLGAAVLIALPGRWRRRAAVALGLGLGVLTVLKVVDMGFLSVLGRRFDPVLDWPLLADGYRTLVETSGRPAAIGAAGGAALLAAAVPAGLTVAVVRLGRVTAGVRRPARRTVTALLAAWAVLALAGIQVFAGSPVASDSMAVLARRSVLGVPAAIRDGREFDAEARADAYGGTAPADQLAGLRGKDVVFGVVESYGRSALQDPAMTRITRPALAAADARLTGAGFAARSGFLTSSTYGGGSWLAHASFQSGLWIDNQQRYRRLVSGERLTLTRAFHSAGWHTVAVEPGNTMAWPEASFYGYDEVYDSRNLGYRGPRFGWSRIPDQFTLARFQSEVYARGHAPLMAEVTLTSSHEPWTPVPRMIGWDQVGDGSVFGPQARTGEKRSTLWQKPVKVRGEYAKSVVYSVDSLISWATTYGDDDLVLVMFGDHQPIPLITGHGASHDVPVTVIARDPAVLDRIAGWGWTPGLTPRPDAPVWPMSAFRDRFLSAYAAPARPPH